MESRAKQSLLWSNKYPRNILPTLVSARLGTGFVFSQICICCSSFATDSIHGKLGNRGPTGRYIEIGVGQTVPACAPPPLPILLVMMEIGNPIMIRPTWVKSFLLASPWRCEWQRAGVSNIVRRPVSARGLFVPE